MVNVRQTNAENARPRSIGGRIGMGLATRERTFHLYPPRRRVASSVPAKSARTQTRHVLPIGVRWLFAFYRSHVYTATNLSPSEFLLPLFLYLRGHHLPGDESVRVRERRTV